MFCVYMHTAPNNKVYIGISENPVHRWNNGKGYKQNKHFYSAIGKYGWDNIKHEILFDNLTKEQACQKEIELIAKYKSNNSDFGYNVSTGGECSALGIKHTEETKGKMSEMRKGENCYWYGKHRSAETCHKISESKKGKPIHEKTRKALLYAVNHQSKETRGKIRDAVKGNKYAIKNKVMCIETGIVYESTVDASNKTGISRTGIGRVCNKTKYCKTAGGYHWRFVE